MRALFPLGAPVLALAACVGDIGALTPERAGPRSGSPTTEEAGTSPVTSMSPRAPLPPDVKPPAAASKCAARMSPRLPRLVRLSHTQYANTLRQLLGFDPSKSLADLPTDQAQAGFDRGVDLAVGDALAATYRGVAEDLATQAAASPAFVASVAGCSAAQGMACMGPFIDGFGKRAFRRPLDATERAKLVTLFQQAPSFYASGDDFTRGVRAVVEYALQSPLFLYRVELGATPGAYDVASRLSYILAGTMPDPPLFAAAADGSLQTPQGLAAQARRLLAGEGMRGVLRDFVEQWLDLDDYGNHLAKDKAKYPGFGPELATSLREETLRFAEQVAIDRGKGLGSLLTAPLAYVTSVTAPVYGVRGSFGADLRPADLDPQRRAGLLTQVGFLATHAYYSLSSPIHRGAAVEKKLLCSAIPDPPPNVPQLPPLDPAKYKTTRQLVDAHTAPAACAGCHHAIINPPGFALESFDAVGAWRDTENGVPIDATGKLTGVEEPVDVDGPVALARAIANAPEARSCHGTFWYRYLFGSVESDADRCWIQALGGKLADDGYTFKDLLADYVVFSELGARAPEGDR
jgi:hypothetical protein